MPMPAPSIPGEAAKYGEAALMILADGRFPSGGHAHSNGYEPADRLVGLADPEAIERFIQNRLWTSGRVDACLVANVVGQLDAGTIDWFAVDAEVEARLLTPALRDRSRGLGRQWLRAGRRLFADSIPKELNGTGGDGPHEVAAFAVVAHAVGLGPKRAAMVFLHHLVSGVTTAGIRLRGLDPYMMQGVQLNLLSTIEQLAEEAHELASRPLAEMPATTGPMFEILAEDHAGWDNRLFQS